MLSIKDSTGLEVATVEVSDVSAGSQNYIWDGTAKDGSRAADGLYTVSVTATQGGESVVSRALEFGSVSSVIRGSTSTDLQVGSLGIFKMADVKQIL